MPRNPMPAPKATDQVRAMVASNRPVISVILALFAGFLAAGSLPWLGIPLVLAAALILPKR